MKLSRSLAMLLGLLTVAGFAQEAPTLSFDALVTPAGTSEKGLADSLQTALLQAFFSSGFVRTDGSEEHPSRFELDGTLVREAGNLVLHWSVSDKAYRSVIAADVVVVYDGLTALEPITASAARLASLARAYWQRVSASPPPIPALQSPLVFRGPEEGVEVFWQGHQSIGKVSEGTVTAPYYPFPSNSKLVLTLERPGYRTETIEVSLKPDQDEYPLPQLDRLRIDEGVAFVSTGRILGLGLQYRHYFVPDWAYVAAEAFPFLQWRPGVASSLPVLHLDLGGSVGTWVFFSADSWFRMGFEASVGLSQTLTISSSQPGWYLDGSVSPFGLVLEYNLWGLGVENRLSLPYSVGLPTGLVGPRWMSVDGKYPMVSLGTVMKW